MPRGQFELAPMKLLLLFSLLGMLFCQFVTVHPDAEGELFLTFLTCGTIFLFSVGILIRRRLRQPLQSANPAKEPT